MFAVDWRCGEHRAVNTLLFAQAPVITLQLTGLSVCRMYTLLFKGTTDRTNFRAAFPQLGEGHFMRYPFYRHVSGLRRAMQFTL